MAEPGLPDAGAIRLVILSPGQALRAGLRSVLGSAEEFIVVGEAASLASLEPMPAGCDVIVATAAPSLTSLEQAFPGQEVFPAFLLLCDDPQEAALVLGLPVHAWGVLPLDASADEMAAAVRALHEGLLVGAPHLLQAWLRVGSPTGASYQQQPSDLQADIPDPLTPRETEVLQLLAQGLANKQIAFALGISEHTVKFHISSVYSKLGVGSRTEAIRIGARRGLIVL